jgi:ABC-type multidrug transport system fused ATPase/permease subunit
MATANRHLSETKEKGSAKAKISKESLRQALILFKYLKPHRGKFIGGLIFIALSAFTTSLFPLFLGKMIDAASPGSEVPGMTTSQFDFGLKNIHWSLNTTLLLIFLSTDPTNYFLLCGSVADVSRRTVTADMRKDIKQQLLTMPMSF